MKKPLNRGDDNIFDFRFTIYDFKTEFDGDLRFDSGSGNPESFRGAANSNQTSGHGGRAMSTF